MKMRNSFLKKILNNRNNHKIKYIKIYIIGFEWKADNLLKNIIHP